MKSLLLLVLLLSSSAVAQECLTCRNYAAMGISVDTGSLLATYTGLYERDLTSFGTGWITFGDFVPQDNTVVDKTRQRATTSQWLITSLSTGVDQRLWQGKNVGFYVPAAAGVSVSEKARGWVFTTGLMVKLRYVGFNVRAVKSSINNYAGWGWQVGTTIGLRF